jgi:homoserine dehydrogenase
LRAAKPLSRTDRRTVRVGLLGLGRVGQAVARLASDRTAMQRAGIRVHVEQVLVRDTSKIRHCATPACVTDNAAHFLRGEYDVVVDALPGVEPARTLVARLLERGTSVVTANKALVAEHGELEAIAAKSGASFRFEATALSAVPFLGTFADRPLVAAVDRIVAIVNGTSNYVLSSLAEGVSFDAALARAKTLGLAEPDACRDLDGLDAADTLLLLTSLFGWGRLTRESLDVCGIRVVLPADVAAARSLGGTIKPLVFAQRDADGVQAFVGPSYIDSTEPLASLGGALNGIRLDGRHVSNLFFSGPGAGPDITAATLLDDVVQAVSLDKRRWSRIPPTPAAVFAASPATPWFVRATFRGVVPAQRALAGVAASAGLRVERVCDYASDTSRWLLVGPQGRRDLDAALARLASTHRIQSTAFRRV